jgi:DNA primase
MLNELVDIEFESPMYQSMLEILRQTSTHQSLLQTHDEFIKKEIAGILSEKYELSENWIKKYLINTPTEENILLHAAYTAVLRLKLKQIRKLIKENSLHIAQAVSIEEQNQQLKIKMELKQFEKQIADELGIIVG